MGSLTRSGQTLLFDDPSGAGPFYPDISDFGLEEDYGLLKLVKSFRLFSSSLLLDSNLWRYELLCSFMKIIQNYFFYFVC